MHMIMIAFMLEFYSALSIDEDVGLYLNDIIMEILLLVV